MKLGPFSSEPFAEGLWTLLHVTDGLDVVSLDDRLGRVTGNRRPCTAILILEGSDPASCGTFLEASSAHAVVLIDSEGARAFVGLDNPDWRQLVDVIRRLPSRSRISDSGLPRPCSHRRPPALPHGQSRRRLDRASTAKRVASTQPGSLSDAPRCPRPHRCTWVVGRSSGGAESLGLDRHRQTAGARRRLRAADDDLMVSRDPCLSPRGNRKRFLPTELELRLLCLVLAPEIDGRYAMVIGVLQDDLTRRRPGLTLLAELIFHTAVATWELRRIVHASHSIVAKGLVRPAGSTGCLSTSGSSRVGRWLPISSILGRTGGGRPRRDVASAVRTASGTLHRGDGSGEATRPNITQP